MAFFDFVLDPTSETGAFLYLTNDWIIDTDEEDGGMIPPGCYNYFEVTTGNGAEKWIVHVYGDATVWVSKNGEVVQSRDEPIGGRFAGATGYGMSPNVDFNHTIFELRFPAVRGTAQEGTGQWRSVAISGTSDPVRYNRQQVMRTRARTAAEEAIALSSSSKGGGECSGMDMVEVIRPVMPANFLGFPEAVTPAGLSDGMPVGVQVMEPQPAVVGTVEVCVVIEAHVPSIGLSRSAIDH